MNFQKLKNVNFKKWLNVFLLIQISAILYSFFTDFFIIPSGIYSGGFTGITQIIIYSIISPDELLLRKVWFYVVYLLINLPLIIFGWFKIGKKLSIITLVFIISQELWNLLWTSALMENFKIMPDLLTGNNQIFGVFIFAVLGGTTWAASNSIVYHAGGCGGGTDFIATYFAITKNKSIGKFQRIIQIFILLIAILMDFLIRNTGNFNNLGEAFLNNPIFYASIVFALIASFTFDKCYHNTKEFSLKINHSDEWLVKQINNLKLKYTIENKNILIEAIGKKDISILKRFTKEYLKLNKIENESFVFESARIQSQKEEIKYTIKSQGLKKAKIKHLSQEKDINPPSL